MKPKTFLVCAAVLYLLLASGILLAQPPEPAQEKPEKAAEEYTVKAYSLSFWGGRISGGTFYQGQALEDRTRVQEGSDDITKYNGSVFTDQELIFEDWEYTEPRKEIESGYSLGGRVGMWLSENFHIDLVASVSRSKAITSFINNDPDNPGGPFREVLDEDGGFTIYMGGGNLMYDIKSARFWGFSPFVGFGIGGIINRFSQLEDKTALYFQMLAGLNFNLTSNLQVYSQFNATTFSFSREELQYGKQVTYTSLRFGLTWLIDVVPGS